MVQHPEIFLARPSPKPSCDFPMVLFAFIFATRKRYTSFHNILYSIYDIPSAIRRAPHHFWVPTVCSLEVHYISHDFFHSGYSQSPLRICLFKLVPYSYLLPIFIALLPHLTLWLIFLLLTCANELGVKSPCPLLLKVRIIGFAKSTSHHLGVSGLQCT